MHKTYVHFLGAFCVVLIHTKNVVITESTKFMCIFLGAFLCGSSD